MIIIALFIIYYFIRFPFPDLGMLMLWIILIITTNIIILTAVVGIMSPVFGNIEYMLSTFSVLLFIMFVCIFTASFVSMENWLRVALIFIGIIPFAIGILYAIRIEQIAGYYECNHCHYKYVPTYKRVLFSTHINRRRKMKCPKCNKKTWHKKVLNK